MLVALAFAIGLQDSERETAENLLRSRKITLDFKGADLETVVEYIRSMTDLNFIVDQAAKEKLPTVSITVKDVSVQSALSLLLKPHGLAAMWKDGVICLTTPDQAPVVLEIYDLRDLLHVLEDMPGVEIDLTPSGLGTTITGGVAAVQPALSLEEILKAHTGGKSWEENSKVSLKLQNGLLVVKQTKEVHAQIRRLLGQLRR